ncbi:zinc-binding dehydrogenase [Martelella alba]|uniref:zinc-binding dehydrogenase n=1 Tax=Martelella alba TaxID=2590451 RepID=UPI001AEE49C9|nr:zinc-binding dehydrogenase [Martelella alba]
MIDVEAIGVGSQDAMIRSGALAEFGYREGFVPGSDVVGTVSQLGSDVEETWLGRRVWAFVGQGGYAEKVSAPVQTMVPIPDGVSAQDAVAVGASGVVAHFGLARGGLAAGHSLMIRGAGGPIGVMAVQLAQLAGAAEIAVTASSPERSKRLMDLGATSALDRSGRGYGSSENAYDVILDVAGGPDTGTFFSRLAPNGRMVLVGAVAGMPPETFAAPMLSSFQRSLSFSTLSANPTTVPDADRQRVADGLFHAVVHGQIRAVIAETLELEAVVEAHRRLDKGGLFGKMVLIP